MKRSSEAILQLIAELENDYAYIHESAARSSSKTTSVNRAGTAIYWNE